MREILLYSKVLLADPASLALALKNSSAYKALGSPVSAAVSTLIGTRHPDPTLLRSGSHDEASLAHARAAGLHGRPSCLERSVGGRCQVIRPPEVNQSVAIQPHPSLFAALRCGAMQVTLRASVTEPRLRLAASSHGAMCT